ncbi:MAG: hypothetical protein JXB45_07450 [Candidatus Krumholzibacteriota bacterium]|nr:hypothetical protein [Candidatus Krumholzibacteriota bacterium]
MPLSTAYSLIGSAQPESVQTYFYMLNNLLYSRMESGYHTNDEFFDEDVNVYLANLLTSLILPEHHRNLVRYAMPYDLPLFENLRDEKNPRIKYITYKTNADFLLIHIGIFGNPKGTRPHSIPYLERSTASFIGRGKTYYHLAQSYLFQTSLRPTATGEVLGKLSRGFENYIKILSVMKSEYLNLIRKFSEGEMFHLHQSLSEEDRKGKLKVKYDDFLDAYSRYRKERTAPSKRALDLSIRELRALDPSFKFQPDEPLPD